MLEIKKSLIDIKQTFYNFNIINIFFISNDTFIVFLAFEKNKHCFILFSVYFNLTKSVQADQILKSLFFPNRWRMQGILFKISKKKLLDKNYENKFLHRINKFSY